MKFFIFRITGNLNNFHAVQKRSGNCLQRICRGYKHHLGQVQRYLKVMIPEFAVLFTVQHFQKSGESISFIVCTDFIDLIQQHNRIFYSGRTDSGGNTTGHCTHISSSVAAYLRFVPHTAQRNADIRFLHCPCQRFCNGRFSGARRTCQT